MGNDIKIFLGIIGLTILLIIGLAFNQSKKSANDKAQPVTEQVAGVEIKPETYELGEVSLNGGVVTKVFELQNQTDKNVIIQKIATSCMCTRARVSANGKESKSFGMEHPGDRNPPINFEIPAGTSAQVIVDFDPAAHGPQGTGQFKRVVQLIFSQPSGVKELSFGGTVVK